MVSDTKPAQPDPAGDEQVTALARRVSVSWEQGWRRLTRIWRRSLQFRVVVSTMLLGLLVIGLIGTYLYTAIANGLEEDRVQRAELQALSLTNRAQVLVDAYQAREGDTQAQLAQDLVNALAQPAGDESVSVVFIKSLNNTVSMTLSSLALGVDSEVVTPALRESVSAAPERQATQLIQIQLDGEQVPAIVIGSQIDVPAAGPYDLYFVSPMYQEQATLRLIRTSLLLGGLALTFLIGAVAWLIARQAVTPIRRAASVAQRLEKGDLGERMPVKGEDDLARLANAFNSMADSLQTQIRQLEGLSRVQQRFVSDVSHELRTPLTTVRMAADLIHDSRHEFTPAVSRSAELLHGELDRFEELLADLLEISRFDAGAAALDSEPADLRTIVERVVQDSIPLANRRGSTVIVDVTDHEVEAEVDPRRVQRILRNLVVNAIEHGEGRPVRVTMAANDTAVAVVVEDQGVGLRPGEAGLVFNRFWRADPARARHSGGTGLGLAIALEDARLHQGWLQAWGAPGEGARFRLTLPRRQDLPIGTSPLPLAPSQEAEV